MDEKTKELLSQAQNSLNIVDIVLRDGNFSLDENMPWDFSPSGVSIFYMSSPETAKSFSADRKKKDFQFRAFTHVFGLKIADKEDEQKELVKIEVKFDAVYKESPILEDDAIKAFAIHNVPHHLWPFCREYMHSTLQKMSVKIDPLPIKPPLSLDEEIVGKK